MFINEQTLIRLPVVTKSGDKLGHIIDIEIDVDNHQIRKYFVSSRFQKDTYLIAPSQILQITDEKIVVEDTVIKDPSKLLKKKNILPRNLDAVLPAEFKN
ncbi:MAG: PRC-barrel domain-containing protein [Patescibacteria group bacterium]|jgi:sporulation protein YlmC with PRC-barrel domain